MKYREFSSLAVVASVAFSVLTTEAAVGKPKKLRVRTTAYTHTEADHIKYGRKNAAGGLLKYGKNYTSAAADWSRFPLGTKFKVQGIHSIFVIDDYGRALVGTDTIDLYYPTRSAMNRWGARHVDIEILEFGDYEKSREILKSRTSYAHVRKMLAAIPEKQPPGMMERLLARNSAKPANQESAPVAPVSTPKAPTVAPESKPAAPPVTAPAPVLVASKAPAPPPTPQPAAPAPAPAPIPTPKPAAPVTAPVPVLVASKAPEPGKPSASIPASPQPVETAVAWEDPPPKPALLVAAAAAPSPQPRKFVPLDPAGYEPAPRPEAAREPSNPANTLRERRFRPLPAVWRQDI